MMIMGHSLLYLDFSSFYSDTFPVILVFYAAFIEEYTSAFFILTVLLEQIFWHCPFLLS